MYRNVNNDRPSYIAALDETGRNVKIDKSISFIYAVTVDENNHVHYCKVDYRRQDTLYVIHKYLTDESLTSDEVSLVNSIVIRYGWLDKRLNSVVFIPLTDLVRNVQRNRRPSTDVNKFNAICRQLYLSRRDIKVKAI